MDETRIDYPRTFAGCLAVIVLLFLGALVGRCSAPAAAQETEAPRLDAAITIGSDGTAAAQAAIAELLITLTTTTTAAPQVARQFVPTPPPANDGSRWDQLAQCESTSRWDYPPVNGGFSGGLMFHIGTWRAMGGEEFASDAYLATQAQQIDIAERVLASSGWGAWPGCSRKFGWL